MDIVNIYLLFNRSCTINGLKPRREGSPLYMTWMCVPNSHPFQRPQIYDKPPLKKKKKVYEWPELPKFSDSDLVANYRGYERVYKFKEQYMNRSTFCEIKYLNRLFFFKGRVYDWGWFQNTDSHTRKKIIPRSPHTPPPSLKLFNFCLCKLCAIIFFVNEAQPTACAM